MLVLLLSCCYCAAIVLPQLLSAWKWTHATRQRISGLITCSSLVLGKQLKKVKQNYMFEMITTHRERWPIKDFRNENNGRRTIRSHNQRPTLWTIDKVCVSFWPRRLQSNSPFRYAVTSRTALIVRSWKLEKSGGVSLRSTIENGLSFLCAATASGRPFTYLLPRNTTRVEGRLLLLPGADRMPTHSTD
ncbi:hypothetical protein Y032_0011g1542 [Ancylostoma ceylanicum]|nr:hypothetical protein Y032_0011g1542 [Ancylostoma ceylanicum]